MASLIALRRLLPADRAAGVIVDLAGTGTSWSGSTTFTLSGVAGCSILTKVVSSAVAARLVIATPDIAGNQTLTISDGSHSATVAVGPVRFPRYTPALRRR